MKYRITGANRQTGNDVEIIVDAVDAQAAEHAAIDMGVLVAEIKPEISNNPHSQPRAVVSDGHSPGIPAINVHLPRRGSSLGIGSIVLGTLSFIICWIPAIGILSIPLSGLGLLLAFIGIVISIKRKGSGLGFVLAGMAICLISLSVTIFITFVLVKAVDVMHSAGLKTGSQATANNTSVSAATSSGGNINNVINNSSPTTIPSELTSLIYNDVKIEIVSIGIVREMPDSYLKFRIRVSNQSTQRKIDFYTWGGGVSEVTQSSVYDPLRSATLTDDIGNSYHRGPASNLQFFSNYSIYPGKYTDIDVNFEAPVESAKMLHLSLPAKNLGGQGSLDFRLPVSMITRHNPSKSQPETSSIPKDDSRASVADSALRVQVDEAIKMRLTPEEPTPIPMFDGSAGTWSVLITKNEALDRRKIRDEMDILRRRINDLPDQIERSGSSYRLALSRYEATRSNRNGPSVSLRQVEYAEKEYKSLRKDLEDMKAHLSELKKMEGEVETTRIVWGRLRDYNVVKIVARGKGVDQAKGFGVGSVCKVQGLGKYADDVRTIYIGDDESIASEAGGESDKSPEPKAGSGSNRRQATSADKLELGKIYEAAGNVEMARSVYYDIVSTWPDSSDAIVAKDRIKALESIPKKSPKESD